MESQNRLRMAIQKKGRLADETINLLNQIDCKVNRNEQQLMIAVPNWPLDIILLRDDDIPAAVMEQRCDLGIVGDNVYTECMLVNSSWPKPQQIIPLQYAQCALYVAAPKNSGIGSISDLQGCSIATSYPAILQKFLSEREVNARVVSMAGSVEVAPAIEFADAICDLVSSGSTLVSNGLEKFGEPVFVSQAILIKSSRSLPVELERIYDRLIERLTAVIQARGACYLMMNVPRNALQALKEVIPAAIAADILPTFNQDYVAIQTMCKKSEVWNMTERLRSVGACDIISIDLGICVAPSHQASLIADQPSVPEYSESRPELTGVEILQQVMQRIKQRKESMSETSYVSRLMQQGRTRIAQKIGEEGVEVALAISTRDDESVVSESADLIFHMMVGLVDRGLTLDGVMAELQKRFSQSPKPV